MFFFFQQKTSYEMRISDWSSDVCSSDLPLIWTCTGLRSSVTPPLWFRNAVSEKDLPLNVIPPRARKCGGWKIVPASSVVGTPGNNCWLLSSQENGRASCRERVWLYV